MPTVKCVWPIEPTRPRPRRCAGWGGAGGGGSLAWDDRALLGSLRGCREAAARVVLAFLEDCPRLVRLLREAMAEGDRAELQRLAHRIKGNAAILRASGVREAADRLERAIDGGGLEQAEAHVQALECALQRLNEALRGFIAADGRSPPARASEWPPRGTPGR